MQTDTLILIVAAAAAVMAAILAGMTWSRTRDSAETFASLSTTISEKIDSEMKHTREQSQASIDVLDRRLSEMTGKGWVLWKILRPMSTPRAPFLITS